MLAISPRFRLKAGETDASRKACTSPTLKKSPKQRSQRSIAKAPPVPTRTVCSAIPQSGHLRRDGSREMVKRSTAAKSISLRVPQ
jgi:hypothetical protein